MRNDKPNLIVDLTFCFSVKIIEYTELLESKRKYNLANQLFRSGTSIGANTWEAQDAESKADFIPKFKIAAKEINETKYWLLLCQKVKSYPYPCALIEELDVIQKNSFQNFILLEKVNFQIFKLPDHQINYHVR